MVVEDVLLESTFPELLPAGPTARFRMPVWWPTQTNRQGDGGPLRSHVIERGGCQINRRGRSLAGEVMYRVAVEKTSLEKNTCLRVKRLLCNRESHAEIKKSAQQSMFNSLARKCAHRAGSKTRSQTDVVLFP